MNVGGPVAEIESDAVIAAAGGKIHEEVVVRVAGTRPPVKVNDTVSATSGEHIENRCDFSGSEAE